MSKLVSFFSILFKPGSHLGTWLLIAMCSLLLLLGYFGYLNPIKTYLDAEPFAVKIGDLDISLYIILKGLVALIVLFWGASVVSETGEKYIKRLKRVRSSNRMLIAKAFQIIIYFITFLVMLNVLGIDLTALAIFSGAVGIGVGFGLQKIASNFISGLILLFEKSVEEGDLVELDANLMGYVRQTGARYTLIEGMDGREVMVPNEDFITNRVINWTFSNSKGRIQVPISVAYSVDIELARKLILEAASEHPRCSKDPLPDCFLREFGEGSVNFMLYFWVDNVIDGRFGPQSDVMFSIWQKFKNHDIEIPFPQRDIYIKQMPESLAGKKK